MVIVRRTRQQRDISGARAANKEGLALYVATHGGEYEEPAVEGS